MRISVAVLCGVLLAMLSACTAVTEVNGRPVTGGDAQPKEVSDERRLGLRLQLASRYYEQGNFTIALEEVNQALAIEPNSAAALGLRALVNMELGDTQKARSDFLHALKQEPDNPELNNNYGWFLCRAGQQRASIDYF
ncbi:MAG TPA: tetratricopeptide repeat protein, partial [Burkholderiaceae bacterium]|nr:tetratricopeptide repeat protein [Burkholderiaceae bacterium]